MKNILLFAFTFFTFSANAQVHWKETSDWKIYKIPESIVFKVPTDSLKTLASRTLQQDTMLNFLGLCTILPDSISPLWMGGWVATYVYDGHVNKIQISAYAGFFFDQSSSRFYQIPQELREEWMAYINHILSSW